MSNGTVGRIIHEMSLREPQADSLRAFEQLVSDVDLTQEQGAIKNAIRLGQAKLQQLQEVLGLRLSRVVPQGLLRFPDDYARLTFALATGVGKTRLMGAIAAYLFLEGRSRHFAILAPSSTIFSKLKAEAVMTHPKYLFKGIAGFPPPEVIHADNLATYRPHQRRMLQAPVLFILTPGQIRPRKGSEAERRMRRESELFGPSFVDYLGDLPDLVVFLDEAHRYGQDAATTRAWARAIVDLRAKVVVEMTATPSNPDTVLYAYDLSEALKERRYIKNVVAIYEQRQPTVTEEEWDNHTLLEAVNRLEVKKGAIEAYRHNYPDALPVKPVLLVVCRDAQHHAPQVEAFLQSDRCFDGKYRGKVLRVDSTRPEDEWLPDLLQVEDARNSTEIIVNVAMLKEGWDVTNVYLIAPLRAMLSETLATQTIGRGLRLPFGQRVEESELDTLDVLTFGRETVQEVIEQAKQVGVQVQEPSESGSTVCHTVKPSRDIPVKVPSIALRVISPPHLAGWSAERHVDIDLEERASIARIEAGTGEITVLGEPLQIDVPNPAKRLGQLLCREISEIAGQEDEATRVFQEYFADAGCQSAEQQRDALQVYASQICDDVRDQVDSLVQRAETEYEREERVFETFAFDEVTHSVLARDGIVDQAAAVLPRDKSKSITGWSRSLYPDNKFDTPAEVAVARILDSTEDIVWVRNPVRKFGIHTQAGWHYPDFLIILDGGYILLEVKNRDELNDSNSDAYRKGKSATEWCEIAVRAGHDKWEYWSLPHDAVSRCTTIEHLKRERFLFPST